MKPNPTVLVVDSDRAMRRLLQHLLEPQGYRLHAAENGSEGLKAVAETRPDVMILELALPDMDGLEVLERLREWSRIAVLVLSERTRDADKVAALDHGADDYMPKPFSPLELLARLRVLQRPFRSIPEGPFLMEGDFMVDLSAHQVTCLGRPVKFRPIEEALFYLLARYAGKVVSTSHLMRSVWGERTENRIKDLRVHIVNVRRKLESFGPGLQIETEEGIGYRLSCSSLQQFTATPAGF